MVWSCFFVSVTPFVVEEFVPSSKVMCEVIGQRLHQQIVCVMALPIVRRLTSGCTMSCKLLWIKVDQLLSEAEPSMRSQRIRPLKDA